MHRKALFQSWRLHTTSPYRAFLEPVEETLKNPALRPPGIAVGARVEPIKNEPF